jgi:NAD(P)-dependent dehydrogenase (short-subunit alcohol dehydrogenase family)
MSNDLFNLTGKVALITGAAGSLGSSIAETYAEYGADLILVDLDQDSLSQLADRISTGKQQIQTRVADIGNLSDTSAIFAEVDQKFGKLDILVNVAGPAKIDSPQDMSIEDLEYTIHHLITARFAYCQQAGRMMLARGSGSIINICSVAGFTANGRGHFAYSMSMAAVAQMTRELSTEWSGSGVRTNAIVCGQITNVHLEERMQIDPQLQKNFLRGIPTGRLGRNQDVKGVALLLASDSSSFVTGAMIPVDGGNLAKNAGGTHPGMPEL